VFLAYVLASVAALSLVVALLTRGAAVLVGRLGGQTIRLMHESAEHIVECHTVPPAWQERLARKRGGAMGRAAARGATTVGGCSAPAASDPRSEAAARRVCLRQLDRLIKHFEGSSLVADEEARHLLLAELREARWEWASASWAAMCSPARLRPQPHLPALGDEEDPARA
jgi:hypothetical protein